MLIQPSKRRRAQGQWEWRAYIFLVPQGEREPVVSRTRKTWLRDGTISQKLWPLVEGRNTPQWPEGREVGKIPVAWPSSIYLLWLLIPHCFLVGLDRWLLDGEQSSHGLQGQVTSCTQILHLTPTLLQQAHSKCKSQMIPKGQPLVFLPKFFRLFDIFWFY